MEEKEYLNEQNYQKSKKKIKWIALMIFIIGLVISSLFFTIGALKQSDAKKKNEEEYQQKLEAAKKEEENDKQRLSAISAEVEELSKKKTELSNEMSSLNMSDTNWFSEVNQYQNEISSLDEKIGNLEMEKFKLQHKDYSVFKPMMLSNSHIIFYSLGGMILFLSIMISLMVYFISKRREILAFGIQQTLPLAKEGLEKVTPTVANTAKEVTKGITEGIKEGLNSNKDK